MKEERLYIVGYMASGKSTLGDALAKRLGWSFIDLDEEVEKKEGRTIARIISEEGESYFRKAEATALKSTALLHHVVIACGGGTPCYRDNMEFMTLHGKTLWLIATPERIAERILDAGDKRPLVAGMDKPTLSDFIVKHIRERQPYYSKALWRLSGEHLETAEEISDTVDKALLLPLFTL